MMESSDQTHRGKQISATIIVFLIFLIIPFCAGFMYYNIGAALKQQISSQLENEESVAASAIQVKLNHLVEVASSLAESPQVTADVASGNWNAAASAARDAQNNISYYDPYIDRVVFFDKNGIEQSAYPTLAGGIGINASNADWFTTVMQNGAATISSVTKRHATPSLNVVYVAAPVQRGGVVMGVLALQIPTDNFLDFGYALSMGTYGFTYIVDQKGNVVAHPRYSTTDVANLASTTPVKNILAGESGAMTTHDPVGNQNNFLVYEPVPKYNWGIVIQEPSNEVFAAYNTMVNTEETVECMLVAINILICYLVFRSVGLKRVAGQEK
jgi:hypothetical protein